MKTLISYIAFTLLAVSAASAATLNVNNNPNRPTGHYATIAEAINIASSGDTLLVHGSETSYGNITLTKRLVIIGTGFFPRKENRLTTRLDYVQLGGTASEYVDGSVIQSCIIGSLGCSRATQNIVIRSNKINGPLAILGSNWLVEYNDLYGVVASRVNSCIFKNNLFTYTYSNITGSSLTITNNIFFAAGYVTNSAFKSLSNASVTNNIFYNRAPFSSTSPETPGGIIGNTFQKNLTINTTNNNFMGGTNNTVGTNFINQDPLFNTSLSGVTDFNYDLDLRLQANSPGRNAGTDGTDIGVFGSNLPMNYPISGEPTMGIVKAMSITNPVVLLGGTLNVTVTAKTRN